jgi:hypothetical protein
LSGESKTLRILSWDGGILWSSGWTVLAIQPKPLARAQIEVKLEIMF